MFIYHFVYSIICLFIVSIIYLIIQVNLDMTDSMGPEKLVCHMQNPSYTYDKYLICIGLGPSISSVICENLSYSGPSYPSSPVYSFFLYSFVDLFVYQFLVYMYFQGFSRLFTSFCISETIHQQYKG